MALDLVGPILQTAVACARDGLSQPVGRILVAPGAEVAYDDCCAGQLWARLVEVVPAQMSQQSGVFNRTVSTPCGVLMWQATIGVGVLRCAATVDESLAAPPANVLTLEALQVVQDAADLAEALQCCLAPQVKKLTMGLWTPLGPGGGCVGGEWSMSVLVDNCDCAPQDA